MAEKSETIEKRIMSVKGFGLRHVQAVLQFSGLMISLMLRTNLSVGIVAMVDKSSNESFETFDWDEPTKGLILSSFFWGYFLSQFPGGILSQMYGGKMVLGISLFGASIFTILVPPAAHFGWIHLSVARLINGLFQGLIYPALYTLMPKWIHPSERRLSSIIICGNTFGNFLILLVSGEIATSFMGWPGIFYLSGGIGIIWSMMWYWYGFDSPEDCKYMSVEEKKFLEESGEVASNERLPIPWGKILRSVPFYAAIATHCAYNLGYYTLLAEIPAYMTEALHYDIRSSAFMSSLPYLVLTITTILFSILSDFLINRHWLTQNATRKAFSTFAHWAAMACMIGLGFLTKETATIAVILLVIAVGCGAGADVGFNITYMEMAPNFAGSIYGLANCIANFVAMMGPIFVGYIVVEPTDASHWRIIFFSTASIYLLGSITFLLFGQSKLQEWNNRRSSNPIV